MLCTGSLITLLLFALLASMGRCFAVPASSIRAYDIPLTVAAWWRACPRCWDTIPSACGTHLRVAPCVPSLLGACLLRHWPHPVDPLMPALYALAQQPALCEVPAQLRDGEAISAFLDDTFRCLPCRAVSTCRVELNCGKTRVWNAAVEEPLGLADVQGDSDAVVCRAYVQPYPQGLFVSGTLLDSDAFVPRQLELERAEHDKLLTRIPAVEVLHGKDFP